MNMSYDGIIELDGMEFHAYHGCLEKERREGNTFVVDFHAETELKKAVKSDDLGKTLTMAGCMISWLNKWPSRQTCWRMWPEGSWMQSGMNSRTSYFSRSESPRRTHR